MTIDAVIATKNRLESCTRLINQLLGSSLFNRIILIDASDINNEDNFINDRVLYIKSDISNQPFQRFLGFTISNADVLFFFDDDIRIRDLNDLKLQADLFKNKQVVGASLDIFMDRDNPEQQSGEIRHNLLVNTFKKFKKGEYWIYGLKGEYPEEKGQVHYLKGPAFAVRRASMYKGFDFRLFNIYEKGLGKGEDAILSYTLSMQGQIIFLPKLSIEHMIIGKSAYAQTATSYYKRFAFSRLYHTINFCNLNSSPFYFRILSVFFYYIIISSTLIKSLILLLLKGSKNDFYRIKGLFTGIAHTLTYFWNWGSVKIAEEKWRKKAIEVLNNNQKASPK